MATGEATQVGARPSRMRSRVGLALFFFAVLAIYLSNGRLVDSFDNVPLRYLPLSIIREGNFDLNEFSFLFRGNAFLYPIQYHSGHFLPFAPVGPAVLAVPFYVLPAAAGISAESPWLPHVEKVAAASIGALSALFVFLGLLRLVPGRTALFAAGLYALGTSTFGVSSQSLWPVGSAQFLLAVGIYLLVRGVTDPRWTPFAAFPLAGAALCRPSAALIGLIVAVYVFHHRRRQLLPFALWAVPIAALQLAYNAAYLGSPFFPPGYVSAGGHVLAMTENFGAPLWKGLVGLLVSPAVGFFVYSPVFLFALTGLYRRWRAGDLLARYLAGAALAVILLDSKVNMWWGGANLGPRYVVEVSPILAYFLAFGIPFRRGTWTRALFTVFAAWSVYANGLVAFAFDGTWEHQAKLWSWSGSPIVFYSQRTVDWVRALGPVLTRWAGQLPDSRARTGLAAELRLPAFPSETVTNSFLDLTVRVKNTGHAAWLHRTPDGVGAVRFGWRWLNLDGSLGAREEGRGPWLATDLLPDHRATFVARIPAPAEPGLYELELGMVSEAVAWFGRGGGAPMRVRMKIVGESLCHFERALETMADSTEPPVNLQWVTDATTFKADEVLSARLNISNPGPPRVFYPVIILRWPSGHYSFFDLGRQVFQDLCPGWIERAPPMFLDHGYRTVELPILSLLLGKMPSGSYALYFLYLRPKESRVRVVGWTVLNFERLP